MEITVILLIVVCVLGPIIQVTAISITDTSYYTAGVVEFRPANFEHSTWTPRAHLEDNLKAYTDIITSVEAVETDIIVFPEMTLNSNEEATFVPEPMKSLNSPCDKPTNEIGEKYHDFLIHLSCLAKNVSKYIVINISEKAYCESEEADPRPCASNGLNIFNTNVVFDRNGMVISRYRKVHLWGEPRNTTFLPSYGYFDTDFGVRFGHFICFDLLFYMPAQEMVEKLGIRDFVYPTMWFSQLPFLTAVQIQSAWSYANDVNLLAAGASFPSKGTTGTGIYNGRHGAIHAVMSQKGGQRKIFVGRMKKRVTPLSRLKRDLKSKNINVEKQKLRKNDTIFLKSDFLELYDTLPINISDGNSLQRQICQHNNKTNTKFCCNFELQWIETRNDSNFFLTENSTNRYYYRLGVFNGLRKEQAPESNKLRNCAFLACIGPDINDCGKVFDNETPVRVVFERLVIEASFPTASTFLIMPNSLKADLLPVDVSDFQWHEFDQGSSRKVRYATTSPISNLLTFSIYGNYYDADALDESSCNNSTDSIFCDDGSGKDGGTFLIISFNLMLLCAVTIGLL